MHFIVLIVIEANLVQLLAIVTFSESSLYIAEILAATSTGAGDSKMNSSVGALFDFLPHAIRLNTN